MNRLVRGFTMVEIIIVISVIGILATIGAVGWSNVSSSSNDRIREQDVRQWISTFKLYKSRYVVWPVMPDTSGTAKQVCLGAPSTQSDPSITDCGQYTSGNKISTSSGTQGADFSLLKTETSKVGNFPANSSPPVNTGCCKTVGPFISLTRTVSGSQVTVIGKFINFFQNGCPAGFVNYRHYNTATPSENLDGGPLHGLPDTAPFPCGLEERFTYDPNA